LTFAPALVNVDHSHHSHWSRHNYRRLG
jgi:hypothetical protein